MDWLICCCVNCCCAGWFPHVPHTWSGAGIQACSQLSHSGFSPCRDLYENTDKTETILEMLVEVAPCFQFVLYVRAVFYSSMSCIFIRQVFWHHSEEFNHLEHIERQIHSFLHSVERRHFPKISSCRTPAHVVCRCRLTDWSRSPRCVSTDVRQLFDLTPTCSSNSELEVRHVAFYVFKMRATFPINPGVSSLRGHNYFSLLPVVTSVILKRKRRDKN